MELRHFTPRFSDSAIDLHVAVEKWLVRQYATYSVAQMENGQLLVIEDDDDYCFPFFFLFADFDALAMGGSTADNWSSCDLPNWLIRYVAHKLGITHVKDRINRTHVVEEYFEDDPADVRP